MKLKGILAVVVTLTFNSQLVIAGSISDTYTSGDPLTTTTLDNIKTAVNDNDTNISTNAGSINSVNTLLTRLVTGKKYSDNFVAGTGSATACTSWDAFRASLEPTKYSCVQLINPNGVGTISCDPVEVPNIATALRDGAVASVTIGSDTWNVGTCTGIEINTDSSGGTGTCSCNARNTLRPCIGTTNPNWGNINDGSSVSSCNAPSQAIILNFSSF